MDNASPANPLHTATIIPTCLPEHPAVLSAVQSLADATTKHDGIAPLSEQFLLGLADPRLGHQHYVVQSVEGTGQATVKDSAHSSDFSTGSVWGVAAFDGDSAELFVGAEFRRQGIGEQLYLTLQNDQPKSVAVWAHGNLPPAVNMAKKLKLEVTRHLLVMSVKGQCLSNAAEVENPRGEYVIENLSRSSTRWGTEYVQEQWLTVNNEAFSWHPEQGGWDAERLQRAMETQWFDPEGVLLLWDASEATVSNASRPALAGFHWTKQEKDGSSKNPSVDAVGEVYVIGLANSYRGRKLGDSLMRAGLRHLLNQGVGEVILYVEADNEPAVKAYERLGFAVRENHVVYAPKS
ncbi:MAG: mycothiol synthase [Corynebacterium sp.]|nr:mycothiol synthase [Corynebacterium sp.]